MRHLLSDPAFPDIVGEWAAEQARKELQPPLLRQRQWRRAR